MSWLGLTLVAFVCFALVFLIKQKQISHPALRFPYRRNKALLSPHERAFFEMLQQAAGESYLVFPKVRAAEIISVTALPQRAAWYHAQNQLSPLHFDFLLCRRVDLAVVCTVELAAEQQAADENEREQRDAFLNGLCQAVGLPRVVVPAHQAEAYAAVKQAIENALADTTSPAEHQTAQP